MNELENLRCENQRLRDRIDEIESVVLSGSPRDVRLFGLQPTTSRILAFIASRSVATREAIWTVVYSDDIDRRPEIKTTDVHVSRIRKALAPFGLKIETVWGVGFKMSADDREAVKREIERVKDGAQ